MRAKKPRIFVAEMRNKRAQLRVIVRTLSLGYALSLAIRSNGGIGQHQEESGYC